MTVADMSVIQAEVEVDETHVPSAHRPDCEGRYAVQVGTFKARTKSVTAPFRPPGPRDDSAASDQFQLAGPGGRLSLNRPGSSWQPSQRPFARRRLPRFRRDGS